LARKHSPHRVNALAGDRQVHLDLSEPQVSFNRQYQGRGRPFAGGRGRGRGGTFDRQSSFRNGSSSAVETVDQSVPYLSGSCNIKVLESTNMPVVRGCIGYRTITLLRETGCSGVVVRKSLVSEEQMTGKTQKCVLADGTVVQVGVAKLDVDTPYFKGLVTAWYMESPVYYFIIGHLECVRPPDNPDNN